MDSKKDNTDTSPSVTAPAKPAAAFPAATSTPTKAATPTPKPAVADPAAPPAKAAAPAAKNPTPPIHEAVTQEPTPQLRWLDLLLAAAFAVVAAAATALNSGSFARVALTMPVLLFIPGYLLLQAALAGRERPTTFHVLMAVGLSPPLVGLLALLTATIPGGFTAIPIISLITTACVAMAGIALLRRVMVKPVPVA